MNAFEPQNSAFSEVIQDSFGQQGIMHTLGATMSCVKAGHIEISMPFDPRFTQQNGFLHAGIVSTLIDSACGFAALSLMPAGKGVLAVEFKVNFMRPAVGETFLASGTVLKPGQRITVTEGKLFAANSGQEKKLIAAMQSTMMAV